MPNKSSLYTYILHIILLTYFHFKETNLHSNETCIAALLLSKKEVHSINMFAITLGKLLRGEKMVVLVFFKPKICYHFMLKKMQPFWCIQKRKYRLLQNIF